MVYALAERAGFLFQIYDLARLNLPFQLKTSCYTHYKGRLSIINIRFISKPKRERGGGVVSKPIILVRRTS